MSADSLVPHAAGSYRARRGVDGIETCLQRALSAVQALRSAGVSETIEALDGEPNVPLILAMADGIAALNFDGPAEENWTIRYQWPHVEAWAVIRQSRGPSGHKGTWGACLDQKQAQSLRDAWAAKEGALARRNEWTPDTWTVEFTAVAPSQLMRPDADVAEHVRRSGAFER